MLETHACKVGDVLFRVEETWEENHIHLCVEHWEVEKVTACGAWLRSIEWPRKKRKFALIPGARWVSETEVKALQELIDRKRRQLIIIQQQKIIATETLELAQHALTHATQKNDDVRTVCAKGTP